MTIWQVTVFLDPTDATQNTILSNIRTNAAKFTGVSIQQSGLKFQVVMTLDDTDGTQLSILQLFYTNFAKFTNIAVTKIG